MKKALLIASLIAGSAAHAAEGRLYQWNNPVSGITQMSGKPPAWYRSHSLEGPRVFVFESGRLVDDTGRGVTEERRAELRTVAFGIEEEPEVGPELLFDEEDSFAAQLRLSLPGEAGPAAGPLDEATSDDTPEPGPADDEIQASIDRLKTIIYDWDNRQTARARAILEQNLEE